MLTHLTPNTLRHPSRTCKLIELEPMTEAANPKTYRLTRYFSARLYRDVITVNDIDRLMAFVKREGQGNVVLMTLQPESDANPWADVEVTV